MKEAIRIPGKERKRPPVMPASPRPAAKAKPSAGFSAAMRALGMGGDASSGGGSLGLSGAGAGGGGSGITAEAGTPFPFPWYLKSVTEKLDRQWRPPQEFAADTLCQVVFTIHRDGQISDSKIEKASGDAFFDQLALRAVLYGNPLPPLPGGFPEENLRVHMKFVGKRL